IGTSLRAPDEYRLPTSFADVSNLDKHNNVYARDDRRRLFAIGNRLWHSDSSFKVIPAKYSLLHARSIPSKGGNTEFADMRAAYDALDAETRAEIEDLICEHSQIFSRQQLGFFDFTEEERARFKPVRQRLVRTHPSTGRKSLYLASHAGGIIGWPVPEARARTWPPKLPNARDAPAKPWRPRHPWARAPTWPDQQLRGEMAPQTPQRSGRPGKAVAPSTSVGAGSALEGPRHGPSNSPTFGAPRETRGAPQQPCMTHKP